MWPARWIRVACSTLALLACRPAAACSCATVSLAEQARTSAVVLVVDVIDDRREGAARMARARVIERLRGAAGAEEVEIAFRPHSGRSCDFVSLSRGRWLLFLGQLDGGRLTTLRCDGHSTRLVGARGDALLTKVRATVATALARTEAIARAVAVANDALDVAYARDAPPGAVRPKRTTPWVTARDATAEARGAAWRVRWGQQGRSGFEYDVEIEVPGSGEPRAVRARATFSPD